MPVTPADIAVELGRAAPGSTTPEYLQWSAWIDRAYRAIERRREYLGAAAPPADVVDDVVTLAVARKARNPLGAESITEQVGVDDGNLQQTARYRDGSVDILDEWWGWLFPGLVNNVGSTQTYGAPDIVCPPEVWT